MSRACACAASLALAACATPGPLPSLAGPDVPLEEDERRMWLVLDEAEKRIEASGRLHVDPALDAYLLEVARRLQPASVFQAISFRFRVMRDTTPGAFTLANGAVYVNTGMLARMASEAELAALLGHELAHAVHRDAFRQLRRAQAWTPDEVGLLRLASLTGYRRDLEREADREGILRMRAAGYDTADAPRLFERLRDFSAAEQTKEPPSYYATHPRIEERIESSRQLVAAIGGSGGERRADAYVGRTAGVLLVNARVEAAAGRYRAAWDQVKRYVALEPKDAAGHLLLAEVARRDATAGWEAAALSSYRRAIELDPRCAEAWRGLGLALSKQGDASGARDAFRRYLELAPDAPDRAHVQSTLEGVR